MGLKRARRPQSRGPSPLAISAERRRRILQLDLQGMLRTEIAMAMGLHEQTVRNYLRKAGRVPPPATHPSFEKFTGDGAKPKNEAPRAHLTRTRHVSSAIGDPLPARLIDGLGERLIGLRSKRGLDQDQIARRLNVPIATLGGAEVYSRASVELVRRLALFFRVDFDLLMGWRK